MDLYRHLFVTGEFAERGKILAGLSLDQVNRVPLGAPHSIYGELWHLTRWQSIVAFRDEDLHHEWERGEDFPSTPAASLADWQELVQSYLAGVDRVLSWADSPERLAVESDPGITMADNLASLAVHNAYHFGKIVAIRQQLGAW